MVREAVASHFLSQCRANRCMDHLPYWQAMAVRMKDENAKVRGIAHWPKIFTCIVTFWDLFNQNIFASLRSTSLGLIQDEGSKKKKKAWNPLGAHAWWRDQLQEIGKRQTSNINAFPMVPRSHSNKPSIFMMTNVARYSNEMRATNNKWSNGHEPWVICHVMDKSTGNLHRMSPTKRRSLPLTLCERRPRRIETPGAWQEYVVHSDT